MAAKGFSFAEKYSRWAVAASNLREHLADFPHVAGDLAEMDGMIAEARTLESRQEELRGLAREVGAQLRDLTSEAEKLRSRLRSHLQAKFGPTSESLLKFGFRPRRTPRRTRSTEPVPEPSGPGAIPVPDVTGEK